jgi:hypothetical protein
LKGAAAATPTGAVHNAEFFGIEEPLKVAGPAALATVVRGGVADDVESGNIIGLRATSSR